MKKSCLKIGKNLIRSSEKSEKRVLIRRKDLIQVTALVER